MFDWRSRSEWGRLWRYYQAGIVNTLFGFGLYSLLLAVGFNMYLAQVTAHVLGMVFNYFTYSRYAFSGQTASKSRFFLSYALNYFLGLASLAGIAQFVTNPYLAGLLSTIFVSVINYFVLRDLVFRERPAS